MRLIGHGERIGFGLRHRRGFLHVSRSLLGGGGAGLRGGEARLGILRRAPRGVGLLDHGSLGFVRGLPPLLQHGLFLGDARELRGERGGLAPELLAARSLAAPGAHVLDVFPAESRFAREALTFDVLARGERAEPFAARLALGRYVRGTGG